jgi:hypothetical protein
MLVRVFDPPKYGHRSPGPDSRGCFSIRTPQFGAARGAVLFLRCAILYYRRHVETRNLRTAPIISENDHVCTFRGYSSVVRRRNLIFSPIARSNGEELEWHSVQQFSNPRNHEANLLKNP